MVRWIRLVSGAGVQQEKGERELCQGSRGVPAVGHWWPLVGVSLTAGEAGGSELCSSLTQWLLGVTS